ncbi:hypothetical protein BDR22DRAFT_172650 [Usnea florida]
MRVGFSLAWDITVVGRLSVLVWLEFFRCSHVLSADQANEYPGISVSFLACRKSIMARSLTLSPQSYSKYFILSFMIYLVLG